MVIIYNQFYKKLPSNFIEFCYSVKNDFFNKLFDGLGNRSKGEENGKIMVIFN